MDLLKRGSKGDAVVELQIQLAGFRGTVWDGDFGPGTELQVRSFQRDFMKDSSPDGIVGPNTVRAISEFLNQNPLAWKSLECPCKTCDGFGQGQFKYEYRQGKPQIEAFHHYEYPGIHMAILHSLQAAMFYAKDMDHPVPVITSGYRCWVRNDQKGRKSTNHMGKAIDIDFPLQAGEDKQDDLLRCRRFREILVEKCGFQMGWGARNVKSLEPENIAPTWIHMDVRSYDQIYLADRYFIQGTSASLSAVA